ncbi:MAG: hypothetical protein ACKVJU_13630 [Verrucomicrobiales bacterium]
MTSGAARDPFAAAAPLPERVEAKEVLETAGVYFPEGGSAIYNPKTSQLIVRTTKDQMELVEVYVDSIIGEVEKQIYLKVFFIESNDPLREEPERHAVKGEEVAENSQFFSESVLPAKRMLELLVTADLEGAVEEEIVKGRTNTMVNLGAGPAGVFTDPQLQVLLKAKEKMGGVKLIRAASGVARSGQSAF